VTPYSWYFEPLTHGILNPLPMALSYGIMNPLLRVQYTMERGFDLITVVATYNASGFVSTKIIGVVSRPAIGSIYHDGVQNTMTKI
jgi:hypothetical protein